MSFVASRVRSVRVSNGASRLCNSSALLGFDLATFWPSCKLVFIAKHTTSFAVNIARMRYCEVPLSGYRGFGGTDREESIQTHIRRHFDRALARIASRDTRMRKRSSGNLRLEAARWRSAQMFFGWTAKERAPFRLLDTATVAGARHGVFTHHPKERMRNHTDGAPINLSNAL